jgi:hypothetical protein
MTFPIESPIAARWNEVVLVCKKCMKRQGREQLRADLRSELKSRKCKDIRVVACGCLDLCPKRGVTVVRGSELAEQPPRLHVLDNHAGIEALLEWTLGTAHAPAIGADD